MDGEVAARREIAPRIAAIAPAKLQMVIHRIHSGGRDVPQQGRGRGAITILDGRVPDRVNHMSNSLSASSSNVISVNTLYEGTNALLRGLGYDVDALPEDKTGDYRKVSQEIANIWTHIISSLPGWANVTSDTETPNKLREQYVFAHGIGWQALAMTAAVMAEEEGASWLPKFEATLKSIDWSKTNPDWQNVCMAGDRVNNTGPGVRSTAGYILAKAGMTGPDACILNRSIDGGCRVSSQGDAGHCPGQGWALPAPGNKGKQIADEVIE